MDNLDDITKKYRDEIVNLYKNQDSEYVPDFINEETSDNNNAEMKNSDDMQNTNENIVMSPAISEPLTVYDKNQEQYKSSGYLIVEVTAGSNAFPIENALVIITRMVNGEEKILSILRTNQSGRTDILELPAPVENGTEISSVRPYANYNVITYVDSYFEVQNKNISIFSGITSLLPVNLIPLPAHTDTNQVMTFYEQEPDL